LIHIGFYCFTKIGQTFQNDSEAQERGLKGIFKNPKHFLGAYSPRASSELVSEVGHHLS